MGGLLFYVAVLGLAAALLYPGSPAGHALQQVSSSITGALKGAA